MTQKAEKVFLIGLDGATFDIIDPLIEKGLLPNLEQLIQEGCGMELLSTIHPFSAQAWSSFTTGMNPGKHGIIDFTEHVKDEYGLKFLNASYREGDSLWRILSDFGKRVGVVNVPFTYPPEEVNGFMISGMDAPGTHSHYIYPKGLADEISEKIGEYIIEVSVKDHIAKGQPNKFLKEINSVFELQMKVLKYLIKNKPWDFFVYVCRITDQVQHYFWKYFDPNHPFYEEKADQGLKDAIASVYVTIDRAIGELIASLDDDVNIMIISDHGQGGINGKKIFLNRWLNSQGFLQFNGKRETIGRRISMSLSRESKTDLLDFVRRRVPKCIRKALLRRAPMLKDRFISHEAFSNIEWGKTRAYSDEKRGSIWINVKGFQPDGIVTPGEEYENLRKQIIAKLQGMKDPETKEPIFTDIFKKEELYWGPHLEKAPDIIFTQGKRKYTYDLRRSHGNKKRDSWIDALSENEKVKLPNATHRLEGILIINGKNIHKSGRILQSVNIMDIAPTILYMMGLSIPEEMDGRVLIDRFTKEYRTHHKVTHTLSKAGKRKKKKEYNMEEEEMISERLRDLGYL